MGGKSRICEICGVRERHRPGFFANFPIDEQRCKTWVQIVGKEDLVHIPIEKLNQVRFVCGDHFKAKDFNKKGNRLKKRAYPKLLLSAEPLSDHQLKDFPQHVASKAHTPMNDCTAIPASSSKISNMAATTQNIMTSAPVPMEEEVPAAPVPAASSTMPPAIVKASAPVPMEEEVPAAPVPAASSTTPPAIVKGSAPSRLEEVVPVLPSGSKTPLGISTKQNVIFSAPVPMEEEVPAAPVLAASSTTPPAIVKGSAPSRLEEVVPVLPSGSKTPLATSTKQNVIAWDKTKEKLIRQLQKVKSTVRSLKRNANLIDRLESPMVKEIVELAIKNQKRKPKGRRWTKKYKIACLSILKRSPKAYNYLRHLVPLPSVKTLQNILRKVPMDTGINQQVLEHLKKIAPSYGGDRYCCVVFDEMAIKPRLNYNVAKDQVEGYVDMGTNQRTPELANRALVFMLQGIRKKFKQPLAFYFVKGTVSSAKLATIIKEVITAVNKTGFKVKATVCDQGPTNMGALNILKNASPNEHGPQIKNDFVVDGRKIYIIYDVPHLFKSIRNNFLNNGIICWDGKKAKWEHLMLVHQQNNRLVYLSRVTENHVKPKYRAKMKVKYAAQALSNTVSSVLRLMGRCSEYSREQQEQLTESGDVVHDLDRLFDFTNGPSGPKDIIKGQRENVSLKTDHLKVWTEYRKKIEKLAFFKPNGTQAKNVRCDQGFLTTLCSFRDLWEEMKRLGFNYLNLRQLNQDALENFFGVIRQHSPTNKNPTVSSFMAAVKSIIITGMSAPHGRGFNCEQDAGELLTDLQKFVFGQEEETDTNEKENEADKNRKIENMEDEVGVMLSIPEDEADEVGENLVNIEAQPIVYISGWLAMRVIKSQIKSCHECKKSLIEENPGDNEVFSYIKLREWWSDKNSLTYPSIELCNHVQKCVNIFENDVIPVLHRDNIIKWIITIYLAMTDSSLIKCEVHRIKIIEEISFRLALLLVRRQCQRINQKVSAQEEQIADRVKVAQQQGIAK